MSKITPALFTVATLLALGSGVASARAQALDGLVTRSFVSAGGNDASSCSRRAPCRTLAAALAKTAAGGEINILDAGGYDTVTIDKAISIVNDGAGTASILVPEGGTGIQITNPFDEAKVNLRGLTIEGAGIGATGIFFAGGRSLTVQNCVIRNLFTGIQFAPSGRQLPQDRPRVAQSSLTVSNTTVADVEGDGVVIGPGDTGFVKATLHRVEIYNSAQAGIRIIGGASKRNIHVAVSDSILSQNIQGITATTPRTHAPVKVMVTRSTIANSFFHGLVAEATPPSPPGIEPPGQVDLGSIVEMWVGQSSIFGNGTGVEASGGAQLRSFGDNNIAGNRVDGTPTAVANK